ncbi:MAG TPA: SMP-30/gluconolactonase/LRE family protein [Sphingobacteriaceae bacterium]|nr:SMP-30/gluconolactonase/LRE family protein [Sphingobacteriaceae bacterium]
MDKKSNLEIAVNHSSLLGEGPVWDANRGVIVWVDILNGEIHEFSPDQKIHKIVKVHQNIGSIALCKDGNFLAALKNGFAFVNRENGDVTMIVNPEDHLPFNRFNDGKCDPAGRFWAGTMSLNEELNAGCVYAIEKDLTVKKKIDQVSIANGMAWNLDHTTFYFIDTPTHEIVAYQYDKETGSISDKKTLVSIPKEDGFPDGMTIDNEGMLWIAHWNGWQVTRWNPDTGEKLYNIPLPVSRVTSCTFGGENLEDLYITSAKVGLSDSELLDQPLAGSLFVKKKCGFKGVLAVEF